MTRAPQDAELTSQLASLLAVHVQLWGDGLVDGMRPLSQQGQQQGGEAKQRMDTVRRIFLFVWATSGRVVQVGG